MNKKRVMSVDKLIQNAFVDLMTSQYFSDITVTALIKKAGVSRASFYRNYTSTIDVLNRILDDVMDELTASIFPALNSSDAQCWRECLDKFISLVQKHEFLRRSHSFNYTLFMSKLDDRIIAIRKQVYPHKEEDSYQTAGRVGFVTLVIKAWLEDGQKESKEELIEYLIQRLKSI